MRGTSHGVEDAARLYNLHAWANGYFDLTPSGTLAVRAGDGRQVALVDIVAEARAQGLKTPLLLRFNHILRDRAQALGAAFDQAIDALGYAGRYTPVYPIKVNQQGSVVRELLSHPRLSLEAGSKPELLAVLGLLPAGRCIVCNGYKDTAYIRLALMAERLGHPTTLVIEKMSEIPRIAAVSRQLGIAPRLGLRVRLASVSKGHWQNTGGEKSKFGLAAPQVMQALEDLRAEGLLERLELIHFHLGSQVANLRDIRSGLREAARFYVELRAAGAPVQVVDVGGGLGVDYDGTRSRESCSMNYTLADYAAAVVSAMQQAARQADMPEPDLISESGRALTAHHAVLITNVSDCEAAECPPPPVIQAEGPALLQELAALAELPARPLECLEEGRVLMEQAQAAFARGEFSLQDRALAEQLWQRLQFTIRDRLDPNSRAQREALDGLRERLADKLFCNFSLFQSLPDVWAIEQVFPIMPLQRLGERPTRMGLIRDLTCDSDGRIDTYVDRDGLESTLPIHALAEEEDYLLGFFLVGAYQEILGDMHNLFGDTDATNVELGADGSIVLSGMERGDRAEELLEYVHISTGALRESYRSKTLAAGLDPKTAAEFLNVLDNGLRSTTYLG
ncbi:MAG: biosynthetic arginine decarboxylase [Oceanococcaceae bacterium]